MAFSEVHFTVEFEVPTDFRPRFEELASQLCEAAERDEPGTWAYQWFWNQEGTHVVVRELFRDSEAILAHFGAPAFEECLPKMTERANVVRFEVCGDVSSEVLEALEGLPVTHYSPWRGLCRAPEATR